jgi:hypothetical protein
MKRYMSYILVVLIALFASTGEALTVSARSISSGVYEGGVFSPKNDVFEGVYHIDEENGEITLVKVTANDREGRTEENISYEIIGSMISEGFSALTVSAERKGQKIYTAVRESNVGGFEVLMMGEDFYEYSRAAGGKFYLESGRVER